MIASSDLSEHLGFMAINDDVKGRLRGVKAELMSAMPQAMDAFYAQAGAFATTRAFFRDVEHQSAARDRQILHWERIASGRFDEAYAASVQTIGAVHAKIGLETRWYIGGYAIVLDSLIRQIIDHRWPRGLGFKKSGADDLGADLGAIIKAALLDIELSISVYFRAADEARRNAE